MEQKNEANEQKLASYEHEIDELKCKNVELEQANQTLQNNLTARMNSIEGSRESTHAGAAPSFLSVRLSELEEDVEQLSRHYDTVSRQIECERIFGRFWTRR